MKQPKIALVIKNPAALKDFPSPSFDLCMAALMQDGTAIKYVPAENFTCYEYKQLCDAAVKSKPRALSLIQKERFSRHSLENIASSAVKKNGMALRFVKEQTPEICLEAVKQNPKAFKFVDKAMCDAVSPYCYKLLQKASQEKSKEDQPAKKTKRQSKTVKPDIDLRYAKKQTDALCLEAVQQDGLQLQYVWKQTRRLCREAMKENPEASEYIRNSENFALDDLFGNLADCMGGFAGSMWNLVFYSAAEKVKKIPGTLKLKETQSQAEYYSQCEKAISENFCNVRFVKLALLSEEQYHSLCIKALKEMPQVMILINKTNISGSLYFSICLEMIKTAKVFELENFFSLIENKKLSKEQYGKLVQAFLGVLWSHSDRLPSFGLRLIYGKILGKDNYFAICKKIISKKGSLLEEVQPHLLNKMQYRYLCFTAVKKSCFSIDDVDKKRLDKKDWLALCKTAVKKESSILYRLDTPSPQLLKFAFQNGCGLKYVKRQSYAQCLAILNKKGSELFYVRPDQFTNSQYFNLCKTALKKEDSSLGAVDASFLDLQQYRELCEFAMNSFAGTIRFIEQDKIPKRLYHSWCLKALKLTPMWLDSIPFIDDYFNICLKAVKKDSKCLEYVKYLRLSPQQYKEICGQAKMHTKGADND